MSSGEKAKPPATFEERNPFDISRRSGPEVASEIAKRMAAWKQARARTAPAPTTIPSGDAKLPPIAAPVQPARMPKATTPPPTATPSARGTAPRVPYFASASAIRRAMPPAPSLKQGSARPPAPVSDALAERADEPAIPVVAPALEQASPRHDESHLEVTDDVTVAKPETPPADASPVASIEEAPREADAASAAALSDPVESLSVAVASDPIAAEPDDDERRRAEARALKARWIAAHDLDALIDTSGAGTASTVEAAVATAHEPQAAAEDLDSSLPDEQGEPERGAGLEAAAVVDAPAPEFSAAVRTVTTDGPDEATERREPTFDTPTTRATPAPVAGGDVATEARALDLAALGEMAGRKEPTFDAPVARATPEVAADARPGTAAQDEAADEPLAEPAANAAAEPAAAAERAAADEGLSLAALDEAVGRKEPTFDQPIHRAALEIEPPVRAAIHPRDVETPMVAASDATPEDTADESPPLSIAALDEAAGREEPTFDEPVRPAKPAQTAAPRIALRPIETRIEARRVDTLRADPQLSARRPIFPHIEPEEWDMPPVVAAQASRARRGTGWAIGLGSILLIGGITAPAAIWQQGRQDRVALVDAAPTSPQTLAPAAPTTTTPMANTTAQAPAQVPAQATLPEAPQPETPPTASVAQEAADPAAPTPEASQVAANPPPADPKPATTLGAVGDGGDVNEAPVMAPAAPTVSLASKTATQGTPMVARPFVPEQGNGPFLQVPTTGAATVPVAGAPVQSAAVGVKPNLMGQLKPPKTATTVSAAKPVASKPKPAARKPKPFFQQSPDQMFETLIETLSEGKPVNPNTKPASPSNRR